MARVKAGTKRRRRHKKVLKQAEGFVLGRKNKFRRTMETIRRAGVYAFRDRRTKKRNFRALWISRITAAAAMNDISYSRLISALIKSNVALNRKMLSDIAIVDPATFGGIVNEVRSQAPAV